MTTSELLIYNAVLSLPFILAVTVLTGEAFEGIAALRTEIYNTGALNVSMLLLICSISGVALNFSMFLCTSLNSALTTTIVGTLKGVVATALGFVLLGGVELHALNVTGIALNALGGAAYSVVKYKARARKPPGLVITSGNNSPSASGKPPLSPAPSVNSPPLSPFRPIHQSAGSVPRYRNSPGGAVNVFGDEIRSIVGFENTFSMEILAKA